MRASGSSSERQQFGLCVLYLLRARLSLERDRLPQAEDYLRSAREVLGEVGPEPDGASELLERIVTTLDTLLGNPGEARDLAERLEPELRELTSPTLDAA